MICEFIKLFQHNTLEKEYHMHHAVIMPGETSQWIYALHVLTNL